MCSSPKGGIERQVAPKIHRIRLDILFGELLGLFAHLETISQMQRIPAQN